MIKLYEKELEKEKAWRSFLEKEILNKKSKSEKYTDLLHADLKSCNHKIKWLQKKIYN